jgi:hypothetical protein
MMDSSNIYKDRSASYRATLSSTGTALPARRTAVTSTGTIYPALRMTLPSTETTLSAGWTELDGQF